jgi:hypothetical protein
MAYCCAHARPCYPAHANACSCKIRAWSCAHSRVCCSVHPRACCCAQTSASCYAHARACCPVHAWAGSCLETMAWCCGETMACCCAEIRAWCCVIDLGSKDRKEVSCIWKPIFGIIMLLFACLACSHPYARSCCCAHLCECGHKIGRNYLKTFFHHQAWCQVDAVLPMSATDLQCIGYAPPDLARPNTH